MSCKKNHSSIQNVMTNLPDYQGGPERHKCAACAYERGYNDGISEVYNIDIRQMLDTLPDSQAGEQRHKDATSAYFLGYLDGRRTIL